MVCNYVILYFIYPMLLLLVQGVYNIGLHFYDYYMTKIGRVSWFKRQTVPQPVVFGFGPDQFLKRKKNREKHACNL